MLSKVAPSLFVFLWSTGFIGTVYGVRYSPPFYFVAIRLAIATLLLLLAVQFMKQTQRITREILGPSIMIGLTLHGAYLGGCFFAVANGLPAGITALIVSLQPVLVSIFAAKFLGEPLRLRVIFGLALGLGGLLLVLLPRLTAVGSVRISGISMVACVVGLLGGTTGTILQKKYGAAIPTLAGTSVQYGATGIVLLILALIFEEPDIQWSGQFIGALAWSVFALSFGAILLLFYLLSKASAASVSSLYYLVPAATALEAYLLFGEVISPTALVGTLVTVLGVWLVVGERRATQQKYNS